MTTDELRARLAADATPVRRLARPAVRLRGWAAVTIVFMIAGVLAIGVRDDAAAAIRQPLFLAVTALLVGTAILSASAALTLSIPGAERSLAPRVVSLAAAATWPLLLLGAVARQDDAMGDLEALSVHGACGPLIAVLASVPAWWLLRLVRAGAPLRLAWNAGFVALAGAAAGATAMQLACPIGAPAHHLAEHVMPAALLCVLGAAVGRRWVAASRHLPPG